MQAERVEATRFTQRAAEAAYQRGLTSRLQATEARLPVLAEEMSLLMLDSRRVIQSIQLMKSLGGGYQAAPVVEKNNVYRVMAVTRYFIRHVKTDDSLFFVRVLNK